MLGAEPGGNDPGEGNVDLFLVVKRLLGALLASLIRPAPDGGWEVKLDPPVNRVLPVSRRRISALWERFGE